MNKVILMGRLTENRMFVIHRTLTALWQLQDIH